MLVHYSGFWVQNSGGNDTLSCLSLNYPACSSVLTVNGDSPIQSKQTVGETSKPSNKLGRQNPFWVKMFRFKKDYTSKMQYYDVIA